MFVAKIHGIEVCARCGEQKRLTKDHFVPKCCQMSVNMEGNYVGLCVDCNREKANKVVLPSWYVYLNDNQKKTLCRYMRYARSWIRTHCTDEEVLQFVESL